MSDLELYRKEIDLLDRKLLYLLAERMKVVYKVGLYKKLNNLKPLDQKRWNVVLKSRIQLGKDLQIPRQVVANLFELIHKYAVQIEKNV